MMKFELGRWFVFECLGSGIFLKAPLIGEVWIGRSAGTWDFSWDRR